MQRGPLLYRGTRKFLRLTGLHQYIELSSHHFICVPAWRLELPQRLARGLAVKEIGPAALEELLALRPAARADLLARWAQGHRCLAAFLETAAGAGAPVRRCVASLWIVAGPARLASAFGCVWQIPAGMLWLYDLYSDPSTLGVVAHFNAFLRRCRPEGGDSPMILAGQIETSNRRSRQAHGSLGYREQFVVHSLRLRRGYVHLLHRTGLRGRRWSAGRAVLPLQAFMPSAPSLPTPAPGPVRLLCPRCGRGFALEAEVRCRCGAPVGRWRDGVAVLDERTPYWGEVPQEAMRRVLARAETAGWRQAVDELVPAELQEYVMGSVRASFRDVLPLAPGASILDVGAGWGPIACALADRHRVVALEAVAERARFIALRKRQDRLENLTVMQCPIRDAPLQPGQFDAIIANGVLEWAALGDGDVDPRLCQLSCLVQLRHLLAAGGVLYLAIENRCGWSELRGARDHSGLPYTSLLPRVVARWVCARSAVYRSTFNTGYRTYTYTHRGYRKLFRQAGLELRATWISPRGYNLPTELVPLDERAIRFALARRRSLSAGTRTRDGLHRLMAREWIWRWFGSDFVFLASAAPESGQPAPAPEPGAWLDAAAIGAGERLPSEPRHA